MNKRNRILIGLGFLNYLKNFNINTINIVKMDKII